jgi:hypothetical protein
MFLQISADLLPVCTCRLLPFFETAGSYLKIGIYTILKITADFIFGKLQQSMQIAADFILKNYSSLLILVAKTY